MNNPRALAQMVSNNNPVAPVILWNRTEHCGCGERSNTASRVFCVSACELSVDNVQTFGIWRAHFSPVAQHSNVERSHCETLRTPNTTHSLRIFAGQNATQPASHCAACRRSHSIVWRASSFWYVDGRNLVCIICIRMFSRCRCPDGILCWANADSHSNTAYR